MSTTDWRKLLLAIAGVTLAIALLNSIKHTDTVGRWGGEEFGIVLPNANTAQAEMIAQRIRETVAALELTSESGARITNPTVSQGIASLPAHARSTEDLIELADRALYSAKAHGKDQITIAGPKEE